MTRAYNFDGMVMPKLMPYMRNRANRTPPAERDVSGSLMEVLARYEHELTQEEKNTVGRALNCND